MTDPSRVRVSPHFLLSDLMMCHSMATCGYRNQFEDPDGNKLAEATHLCESLLEPLLEKHGPMSVAYGYISQELSKKIVKYQDPTLPSYHMWNKGAAVDVCVHDWVHEKAPILLACEVDEALDFSRMLSYSESPYLCLASKLGENPPRRAFYCNEFEKKHGKKPKFVTFSAKKSTRERQKQELSVKNWEGQGWPSYHGGGIRQAQHVRLGRYAMLLDFLYSTACVNEGRKNIPSPDVETRRMFYRAGKAYSKILEVTGLKRMSIVRAYESPLSFEESEYNWKDGFIFQCVPPESVDPDEIAEQIIEIDCKHSVGVDNRTRTITIAGS